MLTTILAMIGLTLAIVEVTNSISKEYNLLNNYL